MKLTSLKSSDFELLLSTEKKILYFFAQKHQLQIPPSSPHSHERTCQCIKTVSGPRVVGYYAHHLPPPLPLSLSLSLSLTAGL
jgi:hypothetical protein